MALVAAAARADEPKVELMAEVVHVSDQGAVIDPPQLADMKAKFEREGLKFTSFKRLSQQKVALTRKATDLSLPNGKSVQLTLEELKEGTAKIRVALAPVNAVYTLGRRGDLYVQAGDHQKGKLVVVLSPVASVKPRRLPTASHPGSPVLTEPGPPALTPAPR